MFNFKTDETYALELDERDPLKQYRTNFHIPHTHNGRNKIYFCGHSLGLQPIAARMAVMDELTRWQTQAIDGYFENEGAWYTYPLLLREQLAKIMGAKPLETVLMNSLTVNLHLMLCSFFQPTKQRYKILMAEPSFPSDRYALNSFLKLKGLNPEEALLTWHSDPLLDMQELEHILKEQGDQISLLWFEGVNYLTGQALDIAKITKLGHQYGCTVGFDLAHATGNILLNLHDWEVDFAVCCTYKYLNAGPGAIGGCFVHEKHVDKDLPQLAGWWGNDPNTRFQFAQEFSPYPGADRWQISNPSIFSLAPLRASLALFDQATMPALQKKSHQLTNYLRFLLEDLDLPDLKIITPKADNTHGCQLSLLMRFAKESFEKISNTNLVLDFREPNILRLTPTPLYNSFHEVWNATEILKEAMRMQEAA